MKLYMQMLALACWTTGLTAAVDALCVYMRAVTPSKLALPETPLTTQEQRTHPGERRRVACLMSTSETCGESK